ncbi:MAG: GNAT family N-acetyltransferase [Acidobacteriia bacterium]|nr:GNAT family N-acetyltransferase [Terriglobia bacterium]
MRTEFKRAVLPRDLRALVAFDHRVFPQPDWFPAEAWSEYESFWLIVERRRIGCCTFGEHIDFQHDLRGIDPRLRGTLYVASTGILPAFRGAGFGHLLKAWQVAYARHGGFSRVVTNTRKSNRAMIALNKTFGFRAIRTTPHYYMDPDEPTVVMELLLR